jgi:prepilin-type N-terminal cleavage/methylation domain-containing protein
MRCLKIFSGFSLIELIVVIAIMIIFSGVSISAYFQFSQRQEALNDARNVATTFRRVQSMARNLVYPSGCAGLSGYRLYTDCDVYDDSCKNMKASASCSTGGEIVVFDEDVLLETSFSGLVDVFFVAGSGSPLSSFELTLGMNPYVVQVSVDDNGNINVVNL